MGWCMDDGDQEAWSEMEGKIRKKTSIKQVKLVQARGWFGLACRSSGKGRPSWSHGCSTLHWTSYRGVEEAHYSAERPESFMLSTLASTIIASLPPLSRSL